MKQLRCKLINLYKIMKSKTKNHSRENPVVAVNHSKIRRILITKSLFFTGVEQISPPHIIEVGFRAITS